MIYVRPAIVIYGASRLFNCVTSKRERSNGASGVSVDMYFMCTPNVFLITFFFVFYSKVPLAHL